MSGPEQALQRFVGDNREMEELESLLSEFNLFEALGVARQELRHSDFLAFLLSPSQTHGLGDSFLKRFLHRVITCATVELPISSIDVDIWSFADMDIARERSNIDLLLTSPANRMVIVIENKLDSKEHSNQLQRYKAIVASSYKGWKHAFIYLSPHGVIATDSDYIAMSYSDVAHTLVRQLEVGSEMGASVRLGIEHYLKLLRRHVVDDSNVADLCRRIYQRHKQAIDLINEHSRRTKDDIYAYLQRLIQSDDRFVVDNPTKVFLRFALLEWDGPGFSNASTSGWTASRRHMIFEFVVGSDHLRLWLIVGPGKSERRHVLVEAARSGPDPFFANPSGNDRYTQLFIHDILTPRDFETLSYEEMTDQIDQAWERFAQQEIPVIVETMSPAITTLAEMPP